jgi:hypothetical protein
MRINRAVLAAFLCSATAPATMCDPTGDMTPFDGGQWTTLSDPGSEMQRTVAAARPTEPEVVMQVPDATVVVRERLEVDMRPVDETTTSANALPSTSTAPDPELQARLLMACLGFVLAVAGGVMLLLPRR